MPKSKVDKWAEAKERSEKWNRLSVKEKIESLTKRRGNSLKQISKLKAQLT